MKAASASTMPMFDSITPMIITFNEEANLPRVLARLTWAKRILIVDSGSTDRTLEIAASNPQVRIVRRVFNDFASQCNFGLTHIETPWVLSLDADYELSEELVDEIRDLKPDPDVAGFLTRFIYRVHGRSLRGALYPPRLVLYRKDKARYENEGHGHRVRVDGRTQTLGAVIFHDDRKPLARFLSSQQRYARDEAKYLSVTPTHLLSRTDKIRRSGVAAPLLVLVYTLIGRGCLLDGWAGWHYALQRLIAESMIALELIDRRLEAKSGENAHPIVRAAFRDKSDLQKTL
jgi:glycosyltransferase involved in cell wall biosynthesis